MNIIPDGWIYVLRSLSENPEIKSVENLYKIGFSTLPVEQRIANAAQDPTYLMERVEIVASWKTYNLNTQKLEHLIHQFFCGAQFSFMVKDADGNRHRPREWYVVPFPIIESVIQKILDGSIVNFRYNPSLQSMEELPPQPEKEDEPDTSDMNVLMLIIKKVWFDEILSGRKTIEFRQLKQTTLGRYTWINKEDGQRYLKKFDAIRFYVGYNKERATALVEVVDTIFDPHQQIIEYHLGKILYVKR